MGQAYKKEDTTMDAYKWKGTNGSIQKWKHTKMEAYKNGSIQYPI